MILAGDIGGTHTRLAFFELHRNRPVPMLEVVYPSREHNGLESILEKFLSAHTLPVERAGFGIAGIVRNGRCEAVNLPWIVDAAQLARFLHLRRIALVNDLEATAIGVSVLQPDEYHVLQPGAAQAGGNMAVIAAGTGLGQAGMYWDGRQYHPFATEGGHVDFAPRQDIEMELCRYLRAQFGRVSAERVVSGPGLEQIFEFLKTAGHGEEPAWLSEQRQTQDAPAAIAHAALERKDPLSEKALDLFVSLYGAEAGNLALKTMALAGVWVGGGIAPKILKKLEEPGFLQAFTDKGRLKPLMETIPVRVILNTKTALLGAALRAARI